MRARSVTVQEVQGWLVTQFSELIRVEPREIDVRTPFAAYGLTSREAICLSGDLQAWLGREISPTIIYNFPDIVSLAKYLAYGREVQAEKPVEMPVEVEMEDDLTAILARLDNLSETEAERLLEQELLNRGN